MNSPTEEIIEVYQFLSKCSLVGEINIVDLVCDAFKKSNPEFTREFIEKTIKDYQAKKAIEYWFYKYWTKERFVELALKAFEKV